MPADGGPCRKSPGFSLGTLNPFKPLRWALTCRALIPLMAIFVILNVVGTVQGPAWAVFSKEPFHWNGLMIGLSLGAFGVCHVLAQAFLTGPAVARLGERWALVAGKAFEAGAMISLAFVSHGWILFAMAPIFALGGIGMPAQQSLTTRQVDADRQGQPQGCWPASPRCLARRSSASSALAPEAAGPAPSGSSPPASTCWHRR